MSECYGPHCDDCPLKGRADVVGLKGASDARFLVVTDTPNHKPEAYGKLLSSAASTILGRSMMAEGFEKGDFAYHPQIRCPHDPDIYSSAEKRAIKKACRPYLVEAIKRMAPEAIIPLGAAPSAQTFGRAVKITKVRGIPTRTEEYGDSVLLPTLSPLQCAMYPQHESTLRADCATLGRLVDHDFDVDASVRQSLGDYQLIDDLQFLIDANPERVAYDTENTGLRWYAPDAKLLTMQFAIKPGEAYLLPWDHPDMPQTGRAKARLKRQLRELLCHPDRIVLGQNAKYDCVYTYAQAGVRYKIGGDTLMLAALIDENATTKSLDDLIKRYVPALAGYADVFNATVDKSRMIDLPLDQKFVEYGCGDADAVLRLDDVLYTELERDVALLNHYEYVSLPGLNAFASVELRGMHVDPDRADEFETYMVARQEAAERSLLAQVPKSIKRKHVDAGLKFTRRDFLLDILFYHEEGFCLRPRVFTKSTAKLEGNRRIPSTSTKDHLPYFYDECPFTYELAEFIKNNRILTTNVQGFREKYIEDDMVRSVYNLHKTVTGRSSSEDPNGQNYPKRGPTAMMYRQMFTAPPGYVFLEADLSQAELRIAGDMANDPTMIRIYREAGDIHAHTACIVLGVDMATFLKLDKKEQKDARTKAKAVNFGFLYGMGWRKFIAYAKTQYNVQFTDSEARRIRQAFFERYFKLSEWHKAMRDYARKHKFVRSYSGRVRHLPMIDSQDEGIQAEAERQAINSPVQEFGSSLGVMSMGRINEEVDSEYLSLVGFVHDALYAYVPEEYVEWGAMTLRYYMESNPLEEWFGRRMKVPIVADVGFGLNLGQIHEMGDFEAADPEGVIEVGQYDFDALWADAEEHEIVTLPEQLVPPNNGRLQHSIYSLPY